MPKNPFTTRTKPPSPIVIKGDFESDPFLNKAFMDNINRKGLSVDEALARTKADSIRKSSRDLTKTLFGRKR